MTGRFTWLAERNGFGLLFQDPISEQTSSAPLRASQDQTCAATECVAAGAVGPSITLAGRLRSIFRGHRPGREAIVEAELQEVNLLLMIDEDRDPAAARGDALGAEVDVVVLDLC